MRATVGALIACVVLFIIFFAFSITMSTLTDEIESQTGNMDFSTERSYDDAITDNLDNIITVSNTIWSLSAVGAVINILLIREERKRGGGFFENY